MEFLFPQKGLHSGKILFGNSHNGHLLIPYPMSMETWRVMPTLCAGMMKSLISGIQPVHMAKQVVEGKLEPQKLTKTDPKWFPAAQCHVRCIAAHRELRSVSNTIKQ